MTLEELAELINAADEWKTEFNQIINDNGWTDLTGDTWQVCSDGSQLVYLDDNCVARIKTID